MLKDKNIALYVTGGIAVYKSVALLRALIQAGANVQVAMTDSATEFVTPLMFQILSQHEVYIDTFDESHPERVNHIYLADWADYSIIAPATANVLAKISNGIGDDFVTSTLLATNHPLFIVPAMNTKMYKNPATTRNIKQLEVDGHYVMEPDTGFLAEGYEGKGRFPTNERILEEFTHHVVQLSENKPLAGKKVLVSAGGTKERIDPVRYISNDSSGKMGHQLAQAAYELGADVTLVTASALPSNQFINRISIASAQELYDAMTAQYESTDLLIMAAAVSDYTPAETADHKMKKKDQLTIELKKTPDILKQLGERKTHQFNVGFAAETQNIEMYAKGKLEAKNADMIIANDVGNKAIGFNSENNEVTIFSRLSDPIPVSMMSKQDLAHELLKVIISQMD